MRKILLLGLLAAPSLHAQISPKPPDAVVPVVGSVRGAANSNFKTELQLANPSETAMEGWLILQPLMTARRYELPPRTTLSFGDIVADMGTTGLLSLDVYADRGGVPTIVARAYDDQAEGTTGVTVPAVRAAEVTARNEVAALIVPRDLTRYRFNIGVRTLEGDTQIFFTVYDAAGNQRHVATHTYTANSFRQQPGEAFLATTLRANDSILVEIATGKAIVYATTVDNRTNDSSIQVLRK